MIKEFHQGESVCAIARAIEAGNDVIVEMLLSAGANVDLAGSDGTTPLMKAAGKSNLNIVQKLLQRGADAGKPNKVSTQFYHFQI